MGEPHSSLRVDGDHSFPAGGLVDVSRATYEKTPLAVVEIGPKVFSFVGAGGTVTAVGGSQGCAVIDTGYGPRVAEIRGSIASVLHPSPRWLINTHWHFDHTDGNRTFAEDGTTVVAHANCRARLSQDQFVPSLEWRIRSSPRSAWPALTFHTSVDIDLGSQTLELIPQEPAHTDGDVAVWLPSANVLVMGDLMTNGSYPVIDESSRGSLRGMIRAIERLLRLVNAPVIQYYANVGGRTQRSFLDLERRWSSSFEARNQWRSRDLIMTVPSPGRVLHVESLESI